MIGIIRPLTPAAMAVSSGAASATNMLTKSPREVWVTDSGTTHVIDVDLGAATAIDAVYLGGMSLGIGATWALSTATGMGTGLAAAASGNVALTGATEAPFQSALLRATDVTSRYFRIVVTLPTTAVLQVGALAIGKSWRHPYAYGSGRPLIDTTRKTELFDGGFGVDQGVVKSGFRWRMVDLGKAKSEELFALLRKVGTGRPIVAIEEVDTTPFVDAAVHYGLFDKFEPWERANAVDTVWALSMTEWR
jgi:hypothetical protein